MCGDEHQRCDPQQESDRFCHELLPAALRNIGFRITMNSVGKSQSMPNNKIRSDALSLVTLLLRNSRIAKGNIRIKLAKEQE
jgi:hypothetical protein